MNDFEVIVGVAGKSGGITLLGIQTPEGWKYCRGYSESAQFDVFFNEGDVTSSLLWNRSEIVDTWEEALKLLDEYPWVQLHPFNVHPEFQLKVWTEVLRRHHEFTRYNRLQEWFDACFPEGSDLALLSLWLRQSKYTVVLTGAGMSTESGIPDFRSKDGWWRQIDPQKVASVNALENHYDLFQKFYQFRIRGLEKCQPHRGHFILAKWEEKGIIHAIATQNVDGFHQQAGSKEVYELHGSIRNIRCQNCESLAEVDAFLDGKGCNTCGGKLRPNVVLFGEMLPQNTWNNAIHAIQEADLVVVIGTSLQVYPVNQLPALTNGKTVLINAESTDQDQMFDLVIQGKAGEILQQVNEILL
jgi:NAD-dependent SIR2 family protein deacetylase